MFFDNMWIAARQVLVLYLIVAVGFAVDRLGIFKQKTAQHSNDLLFFITTPATIIKSFILMDFTKDSAGALLKAFLLMSLTIIVGIIIALPFFNKNKNSAVYKYAVSYGNMGYMALPLCEALLGERGVFYCSAGVAAFNIISFTHGVWLMTRDKKEKFFSPKNLILNPGMISLIIGLPLFFFGIKPPETVMTALSHIANLNTPLAMLYLGTYIANTDMKNMFSSYENYLASFLKLAALPLSMLLIFKLMGVSGELLTALIISASAPSANNTVMFSAKYGKDIGAASKEVAFCSLVSVITIPVMIALSI